MIPYWLFFDDKPIAFMSIDVINLNNFPILITSAEVSLTGTNGKLNRGGWQSPTLSSLPQDNVPILIAPGKKERIKINTGFEFSGIYDYLERMDLGNQLYFPVDGPATEIRRVHYHGLVPYLNDYMETLYGKGSTIEISLFTGIKTLIHTRKIKLSQGSDLFDHSGNIDWSAFLGGLAHIKQSKKTNKSSKQN